MEGKPMVAIPLAHDQPAVAARLERLGIAEVLPVMRLSAKRIRAAITRVLNEPGYREAAVKMQTKLHSLRGLDRAVEIIERAFEKYGANPRNSVQAGHEPEGDNPVAVPLASR
jgi:UDP:flavonoid glycosyltransferase YjiC (YdhE family)